MRRHPFSAVNLISDPIHGYIELTKRLEASAAADSGLPAEIVAEEDLLDTAWVQRLRRISQLQSARWVFPTAEHSRFTHGLGVMHEAGLWARHLYPTLRTALSDVEPGGRVPVRRARRRDAPGRRPAPRRGSRPVRPFLRRSRPGRLPGSERPASTRGEDAQPRGPVPADRRARAGPGSSAACAGRPGSCPSAMRSRRARRSTRAGSPSSSRSPPWPTRTMPRWVRWLQPLLSGVFTVDNLDYVRRDAYLTGVAIGPVDVERLRRYSFIGERGLTLYEPGLGCTRDVPDRPPVHVPPGLLPPDRPSHRPRPGRGLRPEHRGDCSATARRPTRWRVRRSRRVRTAPPGGAVGARRGRGRPRRSRRRARSTAAIADAWRGILLRRPRWRSDAEVRAEYEPDAYPAALVESLGAAEPGRVAIDLATVDARPADATATDSLLAVEGLDGRPAPPLSKSLARLPAYSLVARRYLPRSRRSIR